MSAPNQDTIIKKQLQLSQLEVIFRGPLVKDSIVETLSDLTNLDIRYNFEHKIIWVKSEEANYYLVDGDGSQLVHWKKHVQRLVIQPYVETETYQAGDAIYLNGKIYRASQNVPVDTNPLDNQDYWQVIVGESVTYRYLINNQSEIIVYTEIRNPMFSVILGTFETDVNDDYIIGDDGMIKINNQEIVEPYIVRRDDLPNVGGRAYQIIFEEDSLPVLVTGAVNIK